MWIEKQKNGKYKFVDRYKDLRTGKLKKISITLNDKSSRTQRIASKELERMIHERQSEMSPVADVAMTLGALVEKYTAYQLKTVKLSTANRNASACRSIMAMLGPDTLVSSLSAKFVLDRMVNSGRSNITLNEDRTRLIALMHWGFDHDYIEDVTWLRKLKPFKEEIRRKDRIEEKFLEREELSDLISKVSPEHWKRLTEFLALSGLRFGEAAALTERDVDLKSRLIIVSKNYDYINKCVTTPKTSSSVREIHMQDELYQLCKGIKKINKISRRIGGFDTGLFFMDERTGAPVEIAAFNKALRIASKNMDKHVTAHMLRHTHTSLLAEAGMPVEAISRRLGHENSKITRDIYLHVTRRMKERENKKLDAITLLD